ncbi:hypothetical protein [Kitasatospora sp. KL5]|uniref:hypothetical protein n=1 Tax=Kitasatospora sp. KL5 TaxID=3425125 RepID=UPI003D6FE178
MSERPTPDQLDHLLGTADRRRLTPAEAALLRAGVRHLREQGTRCTHELHPTNSPSQAR